MIAAPEGLEFADRYIRRDDARAAFGDAADAYARFQLQTDPLADEAATALMGMGRAGDAMLRRALDRGIGAVEDPPDALVRLFAHVDVVPDWVDFDRIDIGARAYQRTGVAGMLILSAWSLMNGYHSAPAVKPLAFTSQLAAMAPRRLAETSRFVTETVQTGGLQRYREGFKIAVRVRIMHAKVRHMLLRSGRWDWQAWGAPINQADMLGTVIEFSVLVLGGAETMGFRFTDEEREAILHLWRYSGYVSGVDDELLAMIADLERGERTAELLHLIQPGPDDDSLALAAALRDVFNVPTDPLARRLFGKFLERYHDGLVWVFNGDEVAANLNTPNRHWRHAIVPTRAIIGTFERIREASPLLTRAASLVSNHMVRSDVERMLAGREPSFIPVSRPARRPGAKDRAAVA